MNAFQTAIRRRVMWFGSYKRSGELKKVRMWCFLNEAATSSIEFLTGGDSYKVKRVRGNPRVVCNLGSEDGPAVEGTAEIISDPEQLWRGYRAYWKIHPWLMALLGWTIRSRTHSGRQVLVRVQPDDPNPFIQAAASSARPGEVSQTRPNNNP